jgi:hypothetical protein
MSDFFEKELREETPAYKVMVDKNLKQDKNDDKETYTRKVPVRKIGVLKSPDIHYKVSTQKYNFSQ